MNEYRTGLALTTYNPRTHTYDTPDGTAVGAELVDSAGNAADVFRIATIREKQRKPVTQPTGTGGNHGG